MNNLIFINNLIKGNLELIPKIKQNIAKKKNT